MCGKNAEEEEGRTQPGEAGRIMKAWVSKLTDYLFEYCTIVNIAFPGKCNFVNNIKRFSVLTAFWWNYCG